jgi:hypothetical protein
MRFEDNDQVNSDDQMESAPAFPPATRAGSDSSATAEEASDRPEYDRQVADREIPRRPMADVPADAAPVEQTALFERRELDDFNGRWSEIQASFVDEPRRAVEQADALVSDVITDIGDSFGKRRAQLEGQWDGGGEVSTEDLRQIFQRYRSFFSRLLGL